MTHQPPPCRDCVHFNGGGWCRVRARFVRVQRDPLVWGPGRTELRWTGATLASVERETGECGPEATLFRPTFMAKVRAFLGLDRG